PPPDDLRRPRRRHGHARADPRAGAGHADARGARETQREDEAMTEDLRKRIADTIARERIMLFMKGSPSMPQCGFSAAVVGILKEAGVPFGSYNILADEELREGIKEYSSWRTFPQLYVDSKLVGGCDIVRDLHASGELANVLKPAS